MPLLKHESPCRRTHTHTHTHTHRHRQRGKVNNAHIITILTFVQHIHTTEYRNDLTIPCKNTRGKESPSLLWLARPAGATTLSSTAANSLRRMSSAISSGAAVRLARSASSVVAACDRYILYIYI
jgi:hypothetical protein